MSMNSYNFGKDMRQNGTTSVITTYSCRISVLFIKYLSNFVENDLVYRGQHDQGEGGVDGKFLG